MSLQELIPIDNQRNQVAALMRAAQERLCSACEALEAQPAVSAPNQHEDHPPMGYVCFRTREWQRNGGGGGTARVLSNGAVFERAGVNVSAVHGDEVPQSIWKERPSAQGKPYFATGVSVVVHPRNPYVPAFHANFRYFDVDGDWWFGGGMDMTPTYGFEEDATFFHHVLKDYCDRHSLVYYETLKQACDRYFYIKHRQEMRGVGGIFFDTLQPTGPEGWEQAMAFVHDGIDTILAAYVPLVQRRMTTPYGRRERNWQIYQRGRYAEFNLVYDRGTAFGLQSSGDIEAVLMSMPPVARWDFCYQPEPGSPEAGLSAFLQPRDWVAN